MHLASCGEGARHLELFGQIGRTAERRLDHQPISARIRNALLERIVGGAYAPGERLVELQLAREFGTSQAPVREALRDLETAGLVTIRPRRGSFVNDYHARAQHEIYTVRGALEETAMRLAMPRLQDRFGCTSAAS